MASVERLDSNTVQLELKTLICLSWGATKRAYFLPVSSKWRLRNETQRFSRFVGFHFLLLRRSKLQPNRRFSLTEPYWVRFWQITTDKVTVPENTTWYIMTDLSRDIQLSVGNTYGHGSNGSFHPASSDSFNYK
ncbi:hypothetical protein [Cylindrospermum stagnale]|uniref:hypothetical protein n=1 Tax=Cylindrospermum stagnale TaxID=142864 RepID=UPI0012F68D3D|nr:hypothetical protein [Cylindrospermum stagnale]